MFTDKNDLRIYSMIIYSVEAKHLCCIYLKIIIFLLVQVNANELSNGVINAAFMLLFKDSIRLFAAYNEGIINLLGRSFRMLSSQF